MNAIGVFALIAAAAVVFSIIQTFIVQRRKSLAAYAQSLGWQFSPDRVKNMKDVYPEFKCLRRGHSRFAYNIMRGKRDQRDVTAFDYRYVTGSGKNRHTHYFSALCVQSPLPLKPLYIRPEHVFDKMSDFFGFNDIDFESAEFSRKFYVKAPEKRWAYDVIHQRMIEYLLEAPKFHVQFDSKHIMAWRNRRFQTQDFDDAFALIQEILSRLPNYVRKQQLETAD
ncbi:hypothetical protein ACFLT9_10970 [Acidobacteriota bacterium]